MRKRKWLVVLTGLLAVLTAGSLVLWPRADRITQENLDRIREGMSRARVESILGGPPGDYRTVRTRAEAEGASDRTLRADQLYALSSEIVYVEDSRVRRVWIGNEGFIAIYFESEVVAEPLVIKPTGLVSRREPLQMPSKYYVPTTKMDQGPLESLLWRAKCLWQKCVP
jgi:hypothetical protein